MASTVFDVTAANAALKELYSGQAVENLVYQDNPFLAMVPKKTDAGGKYIPQPLIFATGAGRSANFANAQTYQTSPEVRSFLLTRVSDYAIGQISNELILASKTDKMSFIDNAKLTVDSAIRTATNSLAISAFRAGTGTIGVFTISTGVCTLATPSDVVNFELNQAIEVSASDGGAIIGSSAVGYVVAVDRTAGTFTVGTSLGGAAATPTNWSGTMYGRQVGDRNAKISGLAAWLPNTAPTSTTFFGVDRSVDTVRLGGVRYDGRSQSVEEALVDASQLVSREGGRPNYAFVSYAGYAALEKGLGAKVQYNELKQGDIAFSGIKVNGANRVITVLPDRSCPAGQAYLLQMDTWTLYSVGDAPQILRYGDGMEMLRVYNADTAEVRVGYYAQLGCSAPGWNAAVQIAA